MNTPHSSSETPRRLTPTPATLRELYLKSGNQCAFPGCSERILDSQGTLVGQICHIEAALPDGERFNPSITNEMRRAPSNLVLLCANHHIKTNDVSTYSVQVLAQMKQEHEFKFSLAIEKLAASFVDETGTIVPMQASSLSRLNEVLEWNNSDEELEDLRRDIKWAAERLATVPLPAREVLSIIINRGESDIYGTIRANYTDILAAVGGESYRVIEHVKLLEYHNLAYEDIDGEYAWIVVRGPKSSPHIWENLKDFAVASRLPLRTFICELRFDLLD